MYIHTKQIVRSGEKAGKAHKALVMLHGRGSTAASITSLARHLNLKDTAIFAPQATNNSWYPYSFLADDSSNQPALNSALELLHETVGDIQREGISSEKTFFLGFSQGACLVLEYVARNAAAFGGVVAFTGGLIGSSLDVKRYSGDFSQTPILVTTGDPDSHVPLERVNASVEILDGLNAKTTLKVYPGRPHTIIQEEIDLASLLING